jgi:hypothetical protein
VTPVSQSGWALPACAALSNKLFFTTYFVERGLRKHEPAESCTPGVRYGCG